MVSECGFKEHLENEGLEYLRDIKVMICVVCSENIKSQYILPKIKHFLLSV